MTKRDSIPTEIRQDERTQAGFTLVEALVAIVVLVFGLIAITNLMIVAASSNAVANQSTAAATIAAQQLELLKATPYNTLTTGGTPIDNVPPIPNFFRDDSLPGVGVIHTRWEVVATGDPLIRFIRVRSQGTGALSGQRSRAEFTTFRSCTAANCP